MARRQVYNYKDSVKEYYDQEIANKPLEEPIEWSKMIPQTDLVMNLYEALRETGLPCAEAAVRVLTICLETRK